MDAQPSETRPAAEKSWKCGTLVYTASGLIILFVLLLTGDFIWSLRERSAGVIASLMFKKYGASDFLIGLLLTSLPSLLSVLICPIISVRSDRHRGRLGRRIPYLFLTTPIAVAGLIGMALSPWIGQQVIQYANAHHVDSNVMVLCVLGVFWTLFEFGAIAGNTIFTALINDVVPQKMLGRFYGLFRIMSIAAGILYTGFFLEPSNNHPELFFGAVALIYGLGFTAMCFLVKEGKYPDPEPIDPRATPARRFVGATQVYFKECYTNPYYLLVFVFWLLATFSFMPVNTYCIFYAGKCGVSLDTYGKCISAGFIVSLIISFPLGVLADKFHPLRCGIVSIALYGLASFLSFFFIKSPLLFCIAFIAHILLSSIFNTLTASLLLRLLPHDRFAQFASASQILNSFWIILVMPIIGKLLDWLHNDYDYLYLMGFLISAGAVFCGLWLSVWIRRRCGGLEHYQAP